MERMNVHATPRVTAAAMALALVFTVVAAHVAVADDTLMVLSNEASYEFADHISFTLDAEGAESITDVVLRYQIGQDTPTNRRIPEWAPGEILVAQHVEDLSRGEIPPASLVTWWWTLSDDVGRETDTELQSFRYLDSRFDWRSTDGDDVRVWWYKGDDEFAQDIADEARAIFGRLEPLIGSMPDRRVEIVVYASQDDLRPALTARGSTYESRLATLGARVAPDILLLDAGTRSEDLLEVLAHELSHVVLHLRFGSDYLSTASWLDEGLAMYSEGPLEDDEQELLDDAIADDRLMSVRSLTSFPGEAELVPLAYAQSRDIVAYLIDTYGEETFRDLVDAVASGESSLDDVLRQVYDIDQLELYQSYRIHHELGPASTPDPDSASRRSRRGAGGGSPCAATWLVLPAVAVAFWQRRRP